jgi:hypothetical protein
VFEVIDSNEPQAATPRLVRMLAFYEEIMKEKRDQSRQISVLDLFKKSSGSVHHQLYFLTLNMLIQITRLQLKMKCLLLQFSFAYHFKYFVNFS